MTKRIELPIKSTEYCIIGFKAVHGDRYDYSEVEYIDGYEKVKIICREHGAFEQQPIAHFGGHRCPQCIPLLDIGKFFDDL